MNDVERLHGELTGRFPALKIEIDPAEVESGSWFVNVFREGANPVVIEWRPDRGFGLSTPGPDDFGTGVHEAFSNAEATARRVIQLVLSGGPSIPPLGVRLMEARQATGITQAGLAAKLGLSQASVSKLEKRDDLQVSTLARHAEALGATLSIQIRFPDGTVFDLPVGSPAAEPRPEPEGVRPRKRKSAGPRRPGRLARKG